MLGTRVVYPHPGDWSTYARKMRNGDYDILFDAPDFAAWRIEKQQGQPLVKLPGKINFVILAPVDASDLRTPEDLYGRRVCLLPSPSLGAVSVYALYPNPVQQPEFVALAGSYVDVATAVRERRCTAGVVGKNEYLWLLSAEARAGFKVIGETRELTNQGITVSQRIDAAQHERLLQALASPEGLAAAQPLLQRFSKGEPQFLPATVTDYAGHDLLTQNMMFGWSRIDGRSHTAQGGRPARGRLASACKRRAGYRDAGSAAARGAYRPWTVPP